jgi:putative transposase
MGRKRFTEEQIIAVLDEAEAGTRTAELCRKHGMSEATFYKMEGEARRFDGKRAEEVEVP